MEHYESRYALECKEVWLSGFNFAWSLQLCHILIVQHFPAFYFLNLNTVCWESCDIQPSSIKWQVFTSLVQILTHFAGMIWYFGVLN
jgi:hypothetical protein